MSNRVLLLIVCFAMGAVAGVGLCRYAQQRNQKAELVHAPPSCESTPSSGPIRPTAARVIDSIERGRWDDCRKCGYGADLKDGAYFIKIGRSYATIDYGGDKIKVFNGSELAAINTAAKKYLASLDAARERERQKRLNHPFE